LSLLASAPALDGKGEAPDHPATPTVRRVEDAQAHGSGEKHARFTDVEYYAPNEKQDSSGSRPENIVAEEAAGVEAEDDEDKNDGAHYLTRVPMLLLAFGLCVTTFLIGLDQMIIATAIPKITTQFDSLGDVGWYGSAYLLTTTSLQPSFGKIYTYFNIKYTFIVALAIFEGTKLGPPFQQSST
jgi:hypothetical protein